MFKDINQTICTIDINPNEHQIGAEILMLAPFHVHLRVGHRRLAVLEKRIENANKFGDGAKARMWEENHGRLVRALAGQAAMILGPLLKKRRRWFDWTLTALFIASSALYLNRTLWEVGVLVDLMLIMLLWVVESEWQSRQAFINEIVASSFGANKSLDVTLKLRRRKEPVNAKH